MEKVAFNIPAIHCEHCTFTIKMELEEIDGVHNVTADLASKEVMVEFESPATQAKIVDVLKEINYPPA